MTVWSGKVCRGIGGGLHSALDMQEEDGTTHQCDPSEKNRLGLPVAVFASEPLQIHLFEAEHHRSTAEWGDHEQALAAYTTASSSS
ncbi:hypothetical protein H920_07413 [Fukomys damarensis]|uniref:Uncharacterized protein n=1 Tax=Fukomys damarensis TaxID=885580 RepID=A0A091DJJ2_FUKDA|nr:hypothetical protein H920_07413 [Fukomys damarensis]